MPKRALKIIHATHYYTDNSMAVQWKTTGQTREWGNAKPEAGPVA